MDIRKQLMLVCLSACMSECLSICLFVAKDLTNQWTDMVLLFSAAFYDVLGWFNAKRVATLFKLYPIVTWIFIEKLRFGQNILNYVAKQIQHFNFSYVSLFLFLSYAKEGRIAYLKTRIILSQGSKGIRQWPINWSQLLYTKLHLLLMKIVVEMFEHSIEWTNHSIAHCPLSLWLYPQVNQ